MNDEARRTNVLLENLASQFKVFGDRLAFLEQKVDNSFKDLRKEMQAGFMEVHTWISKVEGKVDSVDQRLTNLEKTNKQEHAEIIKSIERLDKEVQVEMKRIK